MVGMTLAAVETAEEVLLLEALVEDGIDFLIGRALFDSFALQKADF